MNVTSKLVASVCNDFLRVYKENKENDTTGIYTGETRSSLTKTSETDENSRLILYLPWRNLLVSFYPTSLEANIKKTAPAKVIFT